MAVPILDRRAILKGAGVSAGALVTAAATGAALEAPPPAVGELPANAMLAAWVLVRPGRPVVLTLAYIDSGGHLVHREPPLELGSGNSDGPTALTSTWRQAQQATGYAQGFAAARIAQAWSVPVAECEIRAGRIEHAPSGRVMRHCVWVDVA
jgi:hypothetical protein